MPQKNPPSRILVAQVIEYQGRDHPVQGHFVLGFSQIDMALDLAGTLAERLGLARPKVVDETALDLLGEYLNTVVGRTISVWDRMGMPVSFGPPSNLQQADILMEDGFQHEHYRLYLPLGTSKLEFQVTFSQVLSPPNQNRTILVVDDSRTLRASICKNLKEWGYEPIEAQDGREAVKKYQERCPRLVMMDLVMPNMGGLDAIMAIREWDPESQFMVMTASDRRDEVVTATTLGVRDYLIKPVNMARLRKSLDEFFNGQGGAARGQ